MTQGNYEGISIREAMDRINAKRDGWYLPNIQRQYVWGSRDSSEEYICLLVDSLMRGFPIGGLVLWETEACIPYREFLGDYVVGSVAKLVPEERWSCNKFLVYDGQQRLQTLHSVLHNRFNGRVLCFDLLFKEDDDAIEDTGFFFRNSGDPGDGHSIALPELTGKSTSKDKIDLRHRYTSEVGLTEEQRLLIEENLDRLWEVFVSTEKRSIAYFPVRSQNAAAVNEVFRRLNTGGMPLTQLEMVLAKIKAVAPYYEENLWTLTQAIKMATGTTPGYHFSAHEIVQLIYMLVFKTTRVDESRVESSNLNEMVEMLKHVEAVLPNVFKYFLFEGFHINARWLLLRQQALLPILAYFVTLEQNGHKWKPVTIDLSLIRTYFVKSQLCDWNTQTMVTAFARMAIDAAKENQAFPLADITKIAVAKNRTGEVHFYQLEGPLWFSLKILTPGREYLFNERTPQIDHIFAKALHDNLPDRDDYRQRVDVIWNMQPTPAGINNFKRAKHPVEYFKSSEGKPSLFSYDFLPDLDSEDFKDEVSFISYRRKQMVAFVEKEYGIVVQENPS